jgi:hypothetical protein
MGRTEAWVQELDFRTWRRRAGGDEQMVRPEGRSPVRSLVAAAFAFAVVGVAGVWMIDAFAGGGDPSEEATTDPADRAPDQDDEQSGLSEGAEQAEHGSVWDGTVPPEVIERVESMPDDPHAALATEAELLGVDVDGALPDGAEVRVVRGSWEEGPGSAMLATEVTLPDGTSDLFLVVLVDEDGEWLVSATFLVEESGDGEGDDDA